MNETISFKKNLIYCRLILPLRTWISITKHRESGDSSCILDILKLISPIRRSPAVDASKLLSSRSTKRCGCSISWQVIPGSIFYMNE